MNARNIWILLALVAGACAVPIDSPLPSGESDNDVAEVGALYAGAILIQI